MVGARMALPLETLVNDSKITQKTQDEKNVSFDNVHYTESI
jgi:hypothetical protein